MRATMMRTPRAMPRIKRRKPGSQEKDGRALVKCMITRVKGSQQMKNKHCSNRDWSLTNGQSDATKPVLYYPSHPRQCLGLRRNFKVVPEKKDFPVLHHLVFCFICSIRASLIRLSDFVSEIWTLYHIWRVAEGSHVLLLKMISGQSDGTLYGG